MVVMGLFLLIPRTNWAGQDRQDDRQLLRVNLNQAVYYLGLQMGVLEDPTGKLGYNEVKDAAFTSHASPSLDFGVTNSAYWFKFDICTLSSGWQKLSQERLLDLGEAFSGRVNWSLYNGHTGFLVASEGSEGSHNGYVRVKVTPQPQTFYIRATSTTSLLMTPRIYTEKAYINHRNNQNILFGFFYGIIIAVAVYNLFLFFTFNDLSYLWYVLYSMFNLLYFMGINGITGRYILSDNPDVLGMLNRSLLGFMVVFMAFLTKSFLMTRTNAPKTDRVILLTIVAAVVLSIVNLIFPARSVNALLILLGILVPLVVVIAAWNSLKTGFNPARLFMIAWALFIVGTVVFALTSAGIIPFHFLGFYGFQTSSGLAAILLSLALADRIKTLRRERFLFKRNLNRLTTILESMESGVFLIDAITHKIMSANQSAEKIIGLSRERIIGKNCREFSLCCSDAPCMAKGAPEGNESREDRLVNAAGEPVPVLKRIKEIELDEKRVILESFSDISKLKETEEALKNAAQARRIFLNNSGQGFLSFGKDLLVGPEYSAECERIFSTSPEGIPIPDLLYAEEEPVDKQNFGSNMLLIFSEEDEYKKALYLSLLPDEFQLKEKFVTAEYKILSHDTMMMIFTDITDNKALEDEILTERNRLRFVVTSIRESGEFFDVLKDFRIFCTETIPALFSEGTETEAVLEQIYRQVHTFKGLFGQQGFIFVPETLHGIETRLSDLKKTARIPDDQGLAPLRTAFNYDRLVEKDLTIISRSLGREFLDREGQISISKNRIRQLENEVQGLLAGDPDARDSRTEKLLQAIRELRYISLKKSLDSHLSGALDLARRQGKQIAPSRVQGEEVMVDPEVYSPFMKSLVHVFRNAVDHGIETPDLRVETGKEEAASLTCRVTAQKGGGIVVTIADDGKGINLDKLKAMAVEKKIYTREEIGRISKEKILDLIFLQDVTTRERVTTISGRGVGLSSVYHELCKLNGRVSVETEENRGTRLRFHLPE